MSNDRSLLELENEFRNELPRYKEKPKITAVPKPATLSKVSEFLNATKCDPAKTSIQTNQNQSDGDTVGDKNVEMNIFITSM